MIHTLILFGVLIGTVAVAEPIDRAEMWTDAEVDAKAKRWGEEVVVERGALSQHESLAKWRQDIFTSDQLPANERIDLLSRALDNISRFSNYQVSERIEIYDMARDTMASIPGHAKYFTDKIEQAYESNAEKVRKIEFPPDWDTEIEELVRNSENPEAYFNWLRAQWGNYEEIRSKNLGMLGHVPSTESVRALGHYLRKRDEPGIKIPSPGTEFSAAKNLTELISNGPMQTWRASYEDVPKWQQWFDDVKAGKRTFRFVGTNVDYTLDGPADADTLKRIRERTSSTQRPKIVRTHVTPSEALAGANQKRPVFHGGIIAAILLCLAALAFLIKRRNVT